MVSRWILKSCFQGRKNSRGIDSILDSLSFSDSVSLYPLCLSLSPYLSLLIFLPIFLSFLFLIIGNLASQFIKIMSLFLTLLVDYHFFRLLNLNLFKYNVYLSKGLTSSYSSTRRCFYNEFFIFNKRVNHIKLSRR